MNTLKIAAAVTAVALAALFSRPVNAVECYSTPTLVNAYRIAFNTGVEAYEIDAVWTPRWLEHFNALDQSGQPAFHAETLMMVFLPHGEIDVILLEAGIGCQRFRTDVHAYDHIHETMQAIYTVPPDPPDHAAMTAE